ncbi:hypothetical protein VNO80_33852 [Phaseolus coccineus]|uniref:Uncharacterized protein n=1 Tax=Phaseolus coccineus TaxID=3886 RepID=A0AAN9KXK0_PHACN
MSSKSRCPPPHRLFHSKLITRPNFIVIRDRKKLSFFSSHVCLTGVNGILNNLESRYYIPTSIAEQESTHTRLDKRSQSELLGEEFRYATRLSSSPREKRSAYVTRMGRRKVKKRWAGLDSKQARRFTKPV